MMKIILMQAIALTACVLTSSCASIFTRGATRVDEFYAGTRTDLAILGEHGQGDSGAYTGGLKPLALIDFPLSAILDTALLPVDAFLVPSNNTYSEQKK